METIDKASNFAHEAVDTLAKVTSQAADALDDKTTHLKYAEQRLLKNCHVYIRDNPATALGIAVATGFLLSRILSSR
ncbi:DUF883 domain-containing protein [Methylomonas paludis]|jgi:ElaB/YqjD/DUF883 family membrane-anchored ribosome-binding protein|uniref:DUF883 domain-containing protein n=1 Tax=Methylomonas paludis TaxID=1173101 RepID=A0A975MKU3_9GAMM|nr:DUF883 domain-containing protein [Methylomonas paludis]QWF69390.1 DUF883 domain-containing protein [Methylomonas paludis]